jgi:hypothetical protein
MRFILRTQAQQSKLRNEPPFTDNPNDYAVVIDGPVLGRICLQEHDPSKDKWLWFLQSPTGASGMADTLELARESLRQRWFVETQKLTRHE